MLLARNLKTVQKSIVRFKSTVPAAAFAGSKRGNFFQNAPKLSNQYLEDPFMIEQLALDIPKEYLGSIQGDLLAFGEKVGGEVYELHLETERNPPRVEHFDPWGNRIDKLITCDAWKQMKKISAVEGLVSIPYEQKFQEFGRLYQIVKLYMFAPSSGMYGCPLAMTDGAAKTLQNITGNKHAKEAYERLISRDPNKFWTSGQWMTERRGGSDVSDGTETVAVPFKPEENLYKLYGYKWFSSATDSDITVTLARAYDQDNNLTKGLTMFLARTRKDDGSLNGLEIHKLKNKLGTRQLPTAELLLDGMLAYSMSPTSKGVANMSSMLNITRLHNSVSAVSYMRRIINLARDYANKRKAFGKLIIDHDLHCQTLGDMEVQCRASFLVLCYAAKLLGKLECNKATKEEQEMLRFLTPLLKLYTAKQAIAVASEGLEAFGGQGYIEETGIPTILRDAQVLSIWEGTTNILSLDALRSIDKSKGASLDLFLKNITLSCEKVTNVASVGLIAERVVKSTKDLRSFVAKADASTLQTSARDFSFSLYRLFAASMIMDRCVKTNFKESDVFLLKKWCIQDLTPILTNNGHSIYDSNAIKQNKSLFMTGYTGQPAANCISAFQK